MSHLPGPGKADLPTGRDRLEDPPELHNPPGLDALSYRIGDYDSFLQLMIHALMDRDHYPLATSPTKLAEPELLPLGFENPAGHGHSAPSNSQPIRPNLFEEGHWILGLLRAWSAVGDVLTFYQERLINEGYLRTARRRQSLHRLAHLLDYRPKPAVGGSVELALVVTEVEGLPPRMELAMGTAVTSVPPPGEEPQTFEIKEARDVRSNWNLLKPSNLDEEVPQEIRLDATELELSGSGLGLEPGAGILIRGRRKDKKDKKEVAFFRLVGSTEVVSEAPVQKTILSWQAPLDPQPSLDLRPAEIELHKSEAYVLRQEARLFGYRAPVWRDQPMAVRRLERTPLGGVQKLTPSASWQALDEGLPETPVRCLACDDAGNLVAGTIGDGLWCRTAGTEIWQRSEGGEQLEVLCFAIEPTGGLLAGTAGGSVYRSTDGGIRWSELTGRSLGRARPMPSRRSKRLVRLPETPIRSLLTMGEGEGWSLVAGTDSGVYLSTDLGATWLPRNKGFPGSDGGETSLVVHALVSDGGRGLYAGTAAGVFHDKGRGFGRSWRAAGRGLPGSDPLTGPGTDGVECLALYRDRRRGKTFLFAGTTRGIFRSTDGGGRWQAARDGMEEATSRDFPSIRSLVLLEDPITVTARLFAASETNLWTSDDFGVSWHPVEPPTSEIGALAAGPRAQLLTASPLAGFAVEQWPSFHLSQGRIDLDRLVSAPADGSWVVLAPDPDLENPPPVGIYRVKSTAIVDRSDFTLEATVTRIEVEADAEFQDHKLQDYKLQDYKLQDYPLRHTRVFLHSQELPILPTTRLADRSTLLTDLKNGLESLEMETSRPLILTTEPTSETSQDIAGSESDKQGADKNQGKSWSRQTTAGALHSTLALAESWSGTKGKDALSNLLVKLQETVKSLSVHGNVVTADEGRSVDNEVLGDGDASQTFQRFQLSEPLAYHRDAPIPRSTLSLQVQEQPWREVRRLYGQPADARIYEIELDHEGRATVVFGDGIHGARLPTGRANVVASYRTGTTDREIPPGSVRLMSSRPLGLERVSNPLAGTAGAAAEGSDSIRRRAPLSLRALDRIVSLSDYEDFASGFPGIDAATVRELILEERTIVHLTVAGRDWDRRSGSLDGLIGDLQAAIEACRGDDQPLEIVPFRRVELEMIGTVRPTGDVVWDELLPRLQSALEERFGFKRSRFGETLSFAEAMRVLQRTPGVESVDIDTFRRFGSADEIEHRMVAGPAAWNSKAGKILAAELVGLESERLQLKRPDDLDRHDSP